MIAPTDEMKQLASRVVDTLKAETANWTEASTVIRMVLAYMFASIENDEERTIRMAQLANDVMALASRFREIEDKAETLQ